MNNEIEIVDPNAPVAFEIETVIDLAIVNDNISPTGVYLYIEEADDQACR